MKRVLLLLAFIGGALGLWSQDMYPGDVNDNGVVNQVDFLYAGIAFGSTGPERPGANTDFTPQAIIPWLASFPNGINYAFADIDGNGEVDEEDYDEGFEDNYGLIHGSITPDTGSPDGTPSIDPPMLVNAVPAVASGGQSVTVSFDIGTAVDPVSNFYGLAFSISYDQALINAEEAEFSVTSSPWYDPGETNSDNLVVTENTPGRLDVAITRLDQNTVNGFGSIGEFSFIVISDVVDFITVDSMFEIKELLMVDANLNPLPITKPWIELISSGIGVSPEVPKINISPNPSSHFVQIKTQSPLTQNPILLDIHGRLVALKVITRRPNYLELDIRHLPGGHYLLLLPTDGRWPSSRIIVQRE